MADRSSHAFRFFSVIGDHGAGFIEDKAFNGSASVVIVAAHQDKRLGIINLIGRGRLMRVGQIPAHRVAHRFILVHPGDPHFVPDQKHLVLLLDVADRRIKHQRGIRR